MKTIKELIPIGVRADLKASWHRATWSSRGYAVPAPTRVKKAVLSRYGNLTGTWVESGTYLGKTTLFLARTAKHVFTIEPSPYLASRAKNKLRSKKNIDVIEGTSENVMPALLETISGDVSFWLDGHTSGGITFLGEQATPIREELAAIAARLHTWDSVAVFVDDFRGFGELRSGEGAYPSRSFLVDWAESVSLKWTIEHDIFVAWR
ncbi:MAG: hypothetical protein F2923_02260 [Actinobacteria bacterium]|uniref:Unannotated protein n=1 Tax=freshwater metagenome TaxID=449393 RepID=A0A6J7GD67_9ZZZZ|nr:hypothetical protein [Actinomycetota bacterium]MTB27444.1 hypothetical protein [Actinomycetota bacterium]